MIKCNPVFVSVRKVEGCYNELPVSYTGREVFMAPRSHILQKTGTSVACSVLMQPAFNLAGTWFTSGASLTKTILSPNSEVEWDNTDAGNLATEGIYSSNDLDKLRMQLMYPTERKASRIISLQRKLSKIHSTNLCLIHGHIF